MQGKIARRAGNTVVPHERLLPTSRRGKKSLSTAAEIWGEVGLSAQALRREGWGGCC